MTSAKKSMFLLLQIVSKLYQSTITCENCWLLMKPSFPVDHMKNHLRHFVWIYGQIKFDCVYNLFWFLENPLDNICEQAILSQNIFHAVQAGATAMGRRQTRQLVHVHLLGRTSFQ